MLRLLLCCAMAFGQAPQQDRLQQLASTGSIQENAPVKASDEIIINASPERVWKLLAEVKRWPEWQPDVTATSIQGPVQPGTDFTWRSGMLIHSHVVLVQPFQELVWTGVAYRAKAIHVWELEQLPGGRTLVKTRESMDGPLLTVFFSSQKLKANHKHWLMALKTAAER